MEKRSGLLPCARLHLAGHGAKPLSIEPRRLRELLSQRNRDRPGAVNTHLLAHLFVAHELLAETWQPVSKKGVKTTSYKLAEAMADVAQVLVDLTGRSEDELSGRLELERRRGRRATP